MILAKVTMLELTREPDTETGATMDPVQIELSDVSAYGSK